MDLEKTLITRYICIAVMIVGCIFTPFMGDSIVGVWICLGVALAAMLTMLVTTVLYWRCPKCRRLLPARNGAIEYCPHCGEHL